MDFWGIGIDRVKSVSLTTAIVLCSFLMGYLVRFLWVKFFRNHGMSLGQEAKKNHDIYNELLALKAKTDADRAYIMRFHNGVEFLPDQSAWKISYTHEIVKPGVTYESARLQNVLVSLIPDIVYPLISGYSSAPGVSFVTCPECPFKKKCMSDSKRIIVIHVEDMASSYCKFHLENQNVKTVIMCGIAIGGAVYGVVGIDFTGTRVPDNMVLPIAQKICAATEHTLYHLKYRKATVDLPIPDSPITQ